MAEDVELRCLAGRRILIVEDETMIAMMIESVLEDHGSVVVGTASSLAEALGVVEREKPDGVTLDCNLNGQISTPVARRLEELGIPYILVTGYVQEALLDPVLSKAPRISKPFTGRGLARAAAEHLCA